jgi:adenylate cyclase
VIEHNDDLFQSLSRLLAADIDPASEQQRIWERYGETVAVVVMDSSGFSRTAQSHGIVYFLSRLLRLRQLVQPLMKEHHCKLLHFEADNTYAAFPSASDAVSAALAIHRAVYRAGLMLTETERYRVKLGVGFGPLLYSETREGYFGNEMNFASKLGEDLAGSDETLLTEAAYEAAHPALTVDFDAAVSEISGVELRYYRHRYQPGD